MIKTINYKVIPPARRRATASKVIDRLKESLANPTLTEDQQAALKAKLEHLNNWAAGKLSLPEEAEET